MRGRKSPPNEVRRAIHDGVKYLKRQQRADGTWTDFAGQPGGVTGPVHAGLAQCRRRSGRRPHPARPAQARARPDGSADHLQPVAANDGLLPADPNVLLQIKRNVVWLQENQITDGPRKGAWSYPGGNGDNSNSQFALLALYEASGRSTPRTGVHVDAARLATGQGLLGRLPELRRLLGLLQGVPGTGSMTCAGIASLVIANDMVSQPDAKVNGDRIQCCGQGDMENDASSGQSTGWDENFTRRAQPRRRSASNSGGSIISTAWSASGG